MSEFKVLSVLVTGSSRGIGFEFVQQFLRSQNPPEKIFATCRDPEAPQSQMAKVVRSPLPAMKTRRSLSGFRRTVAHNSGALSLALGCQQPSGGPLRGLCGTSLERYVLELKKLSEKNPNVIVIQLGCHLLEARVQQIQHAKHKGKKEAEVEEYIKQLAVNDTTDPISVSTSVKEVEKHLNGLRLDLLINNAGVLTRNSLETQTPEDMMRVYNVNVVGPMLVTQAFHPLLKREDGTGRSAIVHISALLGSLQDLPHLFSAFPVISYRCSKAALNMLSRCHSEGYKQDGIISMAIHPGWVKTDLGSDQAPLTKYDSVSAMMRIIFSLSDKDSGTFLDWEGNTIPW